MHLQGVLHINFVCKLLETSEVAVQHHTLALHGKNCGSFTTNELRHRLFELQVDFLGRRVLVLYFRNFALSSLWTSAVCSA